jgi:hypothetical protein
MALPTSGLNDLCNRFHFMVNPLFGNKTGTKQDFSALIQQITQTIAPNQKSLGTQVGMFCLQHRPALHA